MTTMFNRGFSLWVTALVCMNALACFKAFDPDKVRCSQSGRGNCPPGYTCSAKGFCVQGSGSSGSVDANPAGGTAGNVSGSAAGRVSTGVDANGGGGGGGSSGRAGEADAAPADAPTASVCPVGEHSCGGKCVRNDDTSSCGKACTACPNPQDGTATCDGISCGGECPSGKTLCNGVCIQEGTSCPGECPTGTHSCNGMCFASGDAIGCGPACVVCPVPLGASQATCDGTKCGFVCNSGFHACESTCELDDSVSACGDSCAVCPTDPNGTAVCVAGDCAITCNDGYHYCSDVKKCLKDTDQASCGTSCTPCPAIRGGTATCEDGVCGGKCPETQELCNGACIDPAEVCGSCPEGTHNCNGVCASDTSENSCGTSCTPCPAPEGSERSTCTDGTCGFTCSPGRHRCGSVCAADDDASYCGSTCKKCLADSHGTAICQNGECSVRCDSRYHNCGGTCVSNSALETCGLTECTTPCQKPTGGDVTCNGTACVQTCPTNLPQNCNGTCIAANGACDGTCPDGQKRCSSTNTCIPKEGCCSATECPAEGANIVPTCTNNICGTACSPSTYTKCGGTDCFDLTSNATHCGACTTNCASTPATPKCHASECVQCLGNGDCPTSTGRTTCSNYKCVCPPGLTDCGSAGCVNTSTDNNNCGGCGSSGSSRVCVAPNTCGGGGTAGVCGCTPNCGTRVCGAVPNGCGSSCGSCGSGSSCNSAGQCACVPKTAAEVCGSRVCGTVSDGCTGTVACGTQGGACPSGKQCNSSGQCVCPLGAAQSVCGTCLGWDFESGGDNLNDTNGWVRNPDGGWSSTYPQIQRVLSPTYNSSGHSLAITLNHDGGFAVKVPVCPSTDLSNLTFSAQFRIHDLGGASTVDVMNLMFSAPENGFTPAGWITTRPVGVDSWIPVTGGQEWPNGTAYIGLYFSVDSSYDNYWSGTVYLDNVMFQ